MAAHAPPPPSGEPTSAALLPNAFGDTAYRLLDSDQMRFLWPFVRVHCHPHEKLVVQPAGAKGLGVFTTAPVAQGEYLCCYFGTLMHFCPHYSDYTFTITMPNHVYRMVVDASQCGNIARYFNHSDTPNCFSREEYHARHWQAEKLAPYVPNHAWQYMESSDRPGAHYYYRDQHASVWERPESDLVRWPDPTREEIHIAYYATQALPAGHELTIHYGDQYWASRQKEKL